MKTIKETAAATDAMRTGAKALAMTAALAALTTLAVAQDSDKASAAKEWQELKSVSGHDIWDDRQTGNLFVSGGTTVRVSEDAGETVATAPLDKVEKGRHWQAVGFDGDGKGGRFAIFRVDAPTSGLTLDGGKTWSMFTRPMEFNGKVHDGWTFGAVDWSQAEPKRFLAKQHHTQNYWLTEDGGTTWKHLEGLNGYNGLGFGSDGALLIGRVKEKGRNVPDNGIFRSTDGGKTWKRVLECDPLGRHMMRWDKTLYWATKEGLAISNDGGATWKVMDGSPKEIEFGPFFGESEKEILVIGNEGVFQSKDGGRTWALVVRAEMFPQSVTEVEPELRNYAWDWKRRLLYATSMNTKNWKMQIHKLALEKETK
jgi:hypothetical protein